MKNIFKRGIMAVTALAVMLTAVVFDMPAKTVARAATGGCDGTHSGMSAWTDENDLPASGNYYLDTDVNLSTYKTISGSLILCLNGHTVTAASGKHILSIQDSLTLCDCSSGKTGKLIGGVNALYSGGAVDVAGGTFTMNGGTISGNTAGTGGGVFVRSGASFIMNGGTISNNISDSHGGGVYNRGIFTMNGGTISGNRSNINAGGGVFVAASGTFIMNGGMISSNTAYTRGGGVYVNKDGGTFTMSGGIISGNTAADFGGGVCTNGTFEINGKVNISGNTKTDGSDNNLCLFTGKIISIGNDFNTSSTIGVNTEAEPKCNAPVDVTGAITSDISDSFTADKDDRVIVYKYNKVQLSAKHTFSSPTTTPPTCTEPGGETGICTVCNEEAFNPTTPATGHDYGAWSIKTDPTESAAGTAERVCNNDNTHKETKTDVPALTDTSVWTKTSQDDKDVYTSEYGTVEVAKTGGNGDNGNTGDSGDTGNTGNTGNGGNSGNTGSTGNTGNSGNTGCSDNTNNGGDNSNNSDNPVNATNEVRQDENVPKTELATPTEELISAVLTPEEQAQLKDGGEVKFVLQVGETVSDEDKQLAQSSLEADEGLKVAQYMDISLIKEINGSRMKVTKTSEPIKLTFEVPEALRGSARTFEVLRVYDGEATLLSDLDDDENTVTIETDILATYVLVYRESVSASDSGNPATGIAVSLVPIAAALAFVTAAVIRKKKK